MGVPWRWNEDDAKMDGERLKRVDVFMNTDYKDKLAMEDHVLALKSVCTTRARCPGCVSLIQGTARTVESGFKGS